MHLPATYSVCFWMANTKQVCLLNVVPGSCCTCRRSLRCARAHQPWLPCPCTGWERGRDPHSSPVPHSPLTVAHKLLSEAGTKSMEKQTIHQDKSAIPCHGTFQTRLKDGIHHNLPHSFRWVQEFWFDRNFLHRIKAACYCKLIESRPGLCVYSVYDCQRSCPLNTKSYSLSLSQCWPAFCHPCFSVCQEPQQWAWRSGRWRAFRYIPLPGRDRMMRERETIKEIRPRCVACSFLVCCL